MKVFLGWSGSRSKETAETLGEWLPQVIQAIEPCISSGMEKGMRWVSEISNMLENSRVGIICLTPENLDNDWLLFEAGALSRIKDAHVCTFLLDLSAASIGWPLAQFQHTLFNEEDVVKLVHTINKEVEKAGERSLGEKVLNNVFNTFWPQLEEKLRRIMGQQPDVNKPERAEREILEEILELVRAFGRQKDRETGTEHQRKVYYSSGSPKHREIIPSHETTFLLKSLNGVEENMKAVMKCIFWRKPELSGPALKFLELIRKYKSFDDNMRERFCADMSISGGQYDTIVKKLGGSGLICKRDKTWMLSEDFMEFLHTVLQIAEQWSIEDKAQ
jgi:hypothetical protein